MLNPKKTIFFFLGISSISYLAYDKYKSYLVKTHPTYEMAEMILKGDKRVTNFCGRNYKIDSHRMINEDENNVSYRLGLEGIRGNCRVLVKCEKHTHAALKAHSAEQQTFAKKSKEEKSASPFVPYNFNDLIIPTAETLKKMNELLTSKNFSQELMIFNREAYLQGAYHAGKEEVNKCLRKPIENADTFYRMVSMIMIANDSLVFNIRPIGPKFRDYDVEDTLYGYKNYDDVLKRLMNSRFEYNESLQEDFSAEEFRSEIILYKQTKFQQRTQQRKFITILNAIAMLAGYLGYKLLMRQRIDVTTLKSLQSKIINLGNKTALGNTKRLIAITYSYSPINQRFNINGLVMGEKGVKCGIETTAIIDDITPHSNVVMYNLKDSATKDKATNNNTKDKSDVKISI